MADKLRACAVCGKEATQRCSGCRVMRYCGVECQRNHWSASHKAACSHLRDAKDTARLEKTVGDKGTTVPANHIDPKKFYVVIMMRRNGAKEFMYKVEFTYFDPQDKALNDLFELSTMTWHGELYAIVGVPTEYADRVKEIARQIGMKVVDSVPMLISDGCRELFPMSAPNVWTLENRERPAQTPEQVREMYERAMKEEKE